MHKFGDGRPGLIFDIESGPIATRLGLQSTDAGQLLCGSRS